MAGWRTHGEQPINKVLKPGARRASSIEMRIRHEGAGPIESPDERSTQNKGGVRSVNRRQRSEGGRDRNTTHRQSARLIDSRDEVAMGFDRQTLSGRHAPYAWVTFPIERIQYIFSG